MQTSVKFTETQPSRLHEENGARWDIMRLEIHTVGAMMLLTRGVKDVLPGDSVF